MCVCVCVCVWTKTKRAPARGDPTIRDISACVWYLSFSLSLSLSLSRSRSRARARSLSNTHLLASHEEDAPHQREHLRVPRQHRHCEPVESEALFCGFRRDTGAPCQLAAVQLEHLSHPHAHGAYMGPCVCNCANGRAMHGHGRCAGHRDARRRTRAVCGHARSKPAQTRRGTSGPMRGAS